MGSVVHELGGGDRLVDGGDERPREDLVEPALAPRHRGDCGTDARGRLEQCYLPPQAMSTAMISAGHGSSVMRSSWQLSWVRQV
jgi:hypothetical protein